VNLIERLEKFNRKERHILWEQATGSGTTVALSEPYRDSLGDAIGTTIPQGPNHLVLVDYHLNWLYGALLADAGKLDSGSVHSIPAPDPDDPHGRRPYEHNQEDIDLLVAFEADQVQHVVMVEAKGFTSWTNKQMDSKLRRLDRILDDAQPPDNVAFHLVLTSFGPPKKLHVAWGRWADTDGAPPFVPLVKPPGRLLISECDASGKRKQGGQHVRIIG
jgi:hypothetical protein